MRPHLFALRLLLIQRRCHRHSGKGRSERRLRHSGTPKRQRGSCTVSRNFHARGAGFCYDYCSKEKEIPYHAGNQLRLRASVRSTRYHLFRSGRRSTWNSRRTINANKMIQIYLKFLPSKSGILGRTCFCERSTS